MQSRRHSMLESLGGTAIGFVISVLVWQYIVNPLWDLHTGIIANLQITILFTVVSVVRSYYVRRLFNMMHKNNNKAHDQTDRNFGLGPGGQG